jgi:hypothetical protein
VEATHPSRPRKVLGVPVALSQHPDQHSPEPPVLLAVDQEVGFYTTRSPCGERDAAEEIEAIVMLLEMVED